MRICAENAQRTIGKSAYTSTVTGPNHSRVFFPRKRHLNGRSKFLNGEFGPLVINANQSKSIDLCPQCNAELNAVSGGYTLNILTIDVSVTCVDCHSNVVIKDSFVDLKAFKV